MDTFRDVALGITQTYFRYSRQAFFMNGWVYTLNKEGRRGGGEAHDITMLIPQKQIGVRNHYGLTLS